MAAAARPRYLDGRSGKTYDLTPSRWRGDDGTPLTVEPLPGITAAGVDTRTRSLWRYRAALPVDIPDPVTLGEGCTPLVAKRWGGAEGAADGEPLHFKLEWFSPTGSFKDRGTAVMMSYLAREGVRAVLEDSSGNGGASVSAYAAAAGIRATILVPEATSPAKVLQSRACGAEVELVPGAREATAEEALRRSARTTYASHNWHPFFLQGTKTLAYELWEDLGYVAPDNVVTVAGAGSLVLGCDLGFSELLAAGQIERRPRLLVAQPANCAPIHAAFQAGGDGGAPPSSVTYAPTIAEGTAIQEPVRLPEVLRAIRRSDGDTTAVPEAEIESAVRRLARMGLYAEPTSAMAAAAIDHFRARGAIRPGETTVVILTGSGMKAPTTMTRLFS
ncbi:pyridoxal-phosphate dependent enzyme [Streptomyces armeniacus]|uniref:Pyridoxal-phosphate dependent enzyme n=1 Tax=Streptomyces armeniacus TaxID=83291 RepID=A0A345XU56_9ACTN|nr:pyridoxal-phosphate dependent enzyme [Streptomyces armeniacus]AXK35172.1 pyridoxal-phosphate dependent enzyme [Streptomyces armeniacus]